MPTIEVLVGMIASGKSTYARKRAAEEALVISHDDLCRMLHAGMPVGPNAAGYLPELRRAYRAMEQALVREALLSERDVIIDRTHLTAESRLRWLNFAWGWNAAWNIGDGTALRCIPAQIEVVAFPFESPETHARRRFEADARGRTYEQWLAVARHHAAQAESEPLSDSEGFDAIRFLEGS